MTSLATVLSEVSRIAPTLHKAGTFSTAVLEALVRHGSQTTVQRSAETGSGASTLLFSHMSPNHTVFAVDSGTGSIRLIENSPLLRREAVRFVEGPTQITLPRHTFEGSLQLVLIDGPHGYPFPDLEYYYFYPQLDAGALLIVDDIHIPTVTNLFDFLSVDDMFSLKEVVETTAFFKRTDAPTFSPIEDGWWLQPYNQRAFESSTPELLQRNTPDPVEVATPFFVDQFGPFENPAALARLEVSHGEGLLVTGWAIDAARRLPAAAVDLVLDGVAYRTPVRLARADVATAHANRAYLRSGFSARFPAGTLSRGRHDLEIRIVLVGEQHFYSGLRLHFVAT